MISAGEFRKGVTIEIDGQVFVIVDFQHVKPGKGAAFVRTKIKNVVTGGVLERTFNPNDRYPRAHIETKEMEYLYNDGDLYYFMDNETFEQLPLNQRPGRRRRLYYRQGEYAPLPFAFFKGDGVLGRAAELCRASGCRGRARRARRYRFQRRRSMPSSRPDMSAFRCRCFVNVGDMVRVDTRTGEYMERV